MARRRSFLGEQPPEYSRAVENYLQAIYKLQERGERVYPARLATAMSVSAATVVGTLKRLVRQGFVAVSEGKEISLTPQGQELARSVVRRHRLAECLLTEVLGVEWHRAHEEAHRLEHGISPYVEERISRVLGNPTRCPFGFPIPGSGGPEGSPGARPLSEAQEGEKVRVERVPEEDPRLLVFFAQSGLKPGAVVVLREVAPFKGTITLQVGERQVVLGTQVASEVLVSPEGKG